MNRPPKNVLFYVRQLFFCRAREEKDNIDRLGSSPVWKQTGVCYHHFWPTKPQNLPFSGHGRSRSTRPISPKTAFLGEGVLASTAVVVGDVRIGDHSRVVSRGFGGHQLYSGGRPPYQMVHCALADDSQEIGDWVTVGHSAVVHACEIGNECLIGMNCTI